MSDPRPSALRATPAVWALTLAIGALYALQLTWGGPGSEPLMARTGALWRGALADGEVWRLLSVAFVHVDTSHLASNLVVLVALGRVVELLLGSARFALLFAGATLGGAAASLGFTAGLSAGASGGLLGLMAACVIIGLRRGEALPERLRFAARGAAALALAIAVLQSAQEGIDMAAHLGGALTGAGLMALPGMLPATLPDRAPSTALRRAGAVAGALLLACPAAALATGRGWAVMAPPTLVERPWRDVIVPLPPALEARPPRTDGQLTAQLFGRRWRDPAVIGLAMVEGLAPGQSAAGVRALAEQWRAAAPEPGFAPVEPPRIAGDPPTLSARFAGPDGRVLEIAVRALPDRQVRVDVAPMAGHAAPWSGVAARIAEGLRAPPTN